MYELNDFNSIQISVASPEKIREWSYGVGLSADGALVHIPPGLPGLLLGGLEVDGLAGGLVPDPEGAKAQPLPDGGPEEEKVVEKGRRGQEDERPGARQGVLYDGQGEPGHVQPGQPLGLHRQEEEEEELGVGPEGGEGEEEAHIHPF